MVLRLKNVNVKNKLNAVDEYIQFTVKQKTGNKLPFLDTVVHRVGNIAKFSVYRKPTNNDDFTHYLSGHSDRTKSGVVIGFYLRELRVCDEEFLNDELTYVTQAFQKLFSPLGLLKS